MPLPPFKSRSQVLTVPPVATGSQCNYVSVGTNGAFPPALEVTIPAGKLALVWWTVRSGNSGDVASTLAVTTISGAAPSWLFSNNKALDNFYSASGGGFVWSPTDCVVELTLDTPTNIDSAAIFATVGEMCGFESQVGS